MLFEAANWWLDELIRLAFEAMHENCGKGYKIVVCKIINPRFFATKNKLYSYELSDSTLRTAEEFARRDPLVTKLGGFFFYELEQANVIQQLQTKMGDSFEVNVITEYMSACHGVCQETLNFGNPEIMYAREKKEIVVTRKNK